MLSDHVVLSPSIALPALSGFIAAPLVCLALFRATSPCPRVLQEDPPSGAHCPCEQGVQVPAPIVLNVPAEQGVQVPVLL